MQAIYEEGGRDQKKGWRHLQQKWLVRTRQIFSHFINYSIDPRAASFLPLSHPPGQGQAFPGAPAFAACAR